AMAAGRHGQDSSSVESSPRALRGNRRRQSGRRRRRSFTPPPWGRRPSRGPQDGREERRSGAISTIFCATSALGLASRQLGVISLRGAGLWTVAVVLGHMFGEMSHSHPKGPHLLLPDAIAAGSVLVSLGLFLYSRKREREPRLVLDLGLGYMV